MFQKRVQQFIQRRSLLREDGTTVLVGFSGGADSVALLGVLVRLGYKCVALHCNFHLRGEESDRDESFARQFAAALSVPFEKVDFDTQAYAVAHRESIEMAARSLRYRWFADRLRAWKAQAIAVAHHRDDSVETLLMNLLRGSGIRGLGGIHPRNGQVVRPLLEVSRADIEAWVKAQGWMYVTDSSNLSDAYTRNFIRLRVLPLLEQLNPSARETLARSAAHLASAELIYDHAVSEARSVVFCAEHVLSIEALLRCPSPETLLYEWLLPYGFSRIVVGELFAALRGLSGKQFYSPTHRVLKDRDKLYIAPLADNEECAEYAVPLLTDFMAKPLPLSFELIEHTPGFEFDRSPDVAYFDAALLPAQLTLRLPRQGDWMVPFGMRGRKKLSDLFSDLKMTRWEKERQWLLCAQEQIIWVVGKRADQRYRVKEETKIILKVKKVEDVAFG